jgi:hypothetical protein
VTLRKYTDARFEDQSRRIGELREDWNNQHHEIVRDVRELEHTVSGLTGGANEGQRFATLLISALSVVISLGTVITVVLVHH